MSCDSFTDLRIPLEQEFSPSSVTAIWSKKQTTDHDSKLLDFQTAELHVLLEAICALSPSLPISNAGYSSSMNCRFSQHDMPVEPPMSSRLVTTTNINVNDQWLPSSNGTRYIQDDSPSLQSALFHQEPSPASINKDRQLGCEPFLDLGHSGPAPSIFNEQCLTVTPVTCDDSHIKITNHTYDPTTRPTHVNAQSPVSMRLKPNFSSSKTPLAHPPFSNHRSISWPKKPRPHRTLCSRGKTSKFLHTIPENQEWNIQDEYQEDTRAGIVHESFELKSIFENDSDSEDENE